MTSVHPRYSITINELIGTDEIQITLPWWYFYIEISTICSDDAENITEAWLLMFEGQNHDQQALFLSLSLSISHWLCSTSLDQSLINPCQIPPSLFNKVLVFTFPLLSVYLCTNEWAALRCGPQIKTAPRGLLPRFTHTHEWTAPGPAWAPYSLGSC